MTYKKIFSQLLFFSLFLISCDPDNKPVFNLERVKISATINKTNESILIGDTLKVSIQLPDTIISNTGKVYLQSLIWAQFYMTIHKIDTVNGRAIAIKQPNYWTIKGIISSTNTWSFVFDKNSKPYSVIIHFKPSEKGIYYLEVTSQPGELKINNGNEARLIVNFDVPDKHIGLASPFFGAAWTTETLTREAGTYVFRVI